MAEKNPGIKLNDIPLDLFLDYYGKYKGMQEKRYHEKYENGYRLANVSKNGNILKIDTIYTDIALTPSNLIIKVILVKIKLV